MKKVIQLDATAASFSQKIASAIKDFSGNVFEANPKYMDIPNLKLFDRMKAVWNQSSTAAQIGVANFTLDQKGSGYIANETAGTSQNFSLQNLDPNKFTFITVARAKSDGTVTNLLMHNLSLTPTGSDIVPRLQITALGELKLYTGISTSRLGASIPNPLNAHIYTLTFSVTEGLKLYIDGVLSASSTTDKRPLTDSVVRFITQINAGFGCMISINEDLSKLEHAAKLKLIHDTLKEQYAL